MRNDFMLSCVALLGILLIGVGCVSNTLIKTEPPGAKAFIDGRFIGNTPINYSDTDILFSEHALELKLEGYQSVNGLIKRDQLNGATLVAGIFCFFPILWCFDYPPTYTYFLQQVALAANDPALLARLLATPYSYQKY